ncbi:MAG: hypothetical protein ACLFTH_01210 [Candidatus Woesearchaeota archaeon]
MARGRPRYSLVRERLKQLLYLLGPTTAYDAHKHYRELFAKTTRRNIYYQLSKGVDTGVFQIDKVEEEQGDYSWGSSSRKVYYRLAPKTTVTIEDRVKEYTDKLNNNR